MTGPATPPAHPTVSLRGGVEMPQLGYGVALIADDVAARTVAVALREGYRLVDTARAYGNETGVGRAIRDSGIAREDVFVTTKLSNVAHGYDKARRAFDRSLDALGLDYLDLYLLHWPVPTRDLYVETWRALVALRDEGRVRAIGVCNFHLEHLQRLLDETQVAPSVNQVELHPYFGQRALRAVHAKLGIVTEAWSPLGAGNGCLAEPVILELAERHGVSPAQIVIRWHLQAGNVVIPKSEDPGRIRSNAEVFGFALTDAEVEAVGGLDRGVRQGPDPSTFVG